MEVARKKPGLNHLKSSLLDQERHFNWAWKGDSNLRFVVSIGSYHSQINWTRQSFITNPLSSSHDDSTTPNITRVIVVSLQHLTSWCWKTSTKLQNIYIYIYIKRLLKSWCQPPHGPAVPHSRVFQLWLTLPANVGCYKGTVLGKMALQRDMWLENIQSSSDVYIQVLHSKFVLSLSQNAFCGTILVLKSYDRLKNFLAWNLDACGSGVQKLVVVPFPLRRCWTSQNPETSIRKTYFKYHKSSMSALIAQAVHTHVQLARGIIQLQQP